MRHALLLLVNDKLAERIMKRILDLHARRAFSRAIAATVLTVASASLVHAQQPPVTSQNGSSTHAAKKAELKKLEQNGYQPSATQSQYPQNVQGAQQRAAGGAGASQPVPAGKGTQ
jgi:hypothetical protein